MARPGDWSPLGLHGDPVPGDPDVLRNLHTQMEDLGELAREVTSGLNRVLNQSTDSFIGKTAEAVRKKIDGHLKSFIDSVGNSFGVSAPATLDYLNAVVEAQTKADQALASAQGLSKDDDKLVALKAQAHEAQNDYDTAAGRYMDKLLDASHMIKQPISGWKLFLEALGILGIILAVLGAIFGGWVGLIALAVNVALLIKTAVDFAEGKASALDMVLAVIGVLFPSTKGLNIGQLTKGLFNTLKGLGKGLTAGIGDISRGLTHIFINPGALGQTFGLATLKSFTLAGLKGIATIAVNGGKLTLGTLKTIGVTFRNDFRLATIGVTSPLAKIGVYSLSFGSRFLVSATLPLDFFELGVGAKAAISMGLGTRLSTPWAHLAQPIVGGGLHTGAGAAGHMGLGASGNFDGFHSGSGLNPGSLHGFDGGVGIGGLHGLTSIQSVHLGAGVNPASIGHSLSSLGTGASAVDHLTAIDHATGFDRGVSGLLEPMGTHFGGIGSAHMSMDTGSLTSGAAGSHSGISSLAGRHDLSVGAIGLNTAIGDGMSGIRAAHGYAEDFHALGIPELRSIADGDVSVLKVNQDGISLRVGEESGSATAMHVNFSTMSVTDDAGRQVVVAPEAHAALGTTDIRTAAGHQGSSSPQVAPVREAGASGTDATAGASHAPAVDVKAPNREGATTSPSVKETEGPAGASTSAKAPGTATDDADFFAEGGGSHAVTAHDDKLGVSAHQDLDLSGRKDGGTGETSGAAAPARDTRAQPPEPVAVRPENAPPAAGHPPRSRFEAVTGGVGGTVGAERMAAWNGYEKAAADAGRAEKTLQDLGGGLEKPSENIDQAAAKMDAQAAGLGVDAARQDLARLSMDVDSITSRIDALVAQKGPGTGDLDAARHAPGTAGGTATRGLSRDVDLYHEVNIRLQGKEPGTAHMSPDEVAHLYETHFPNGADSRMTVREIADHLSSLTLGRDLPKMRGGGARLEVSAETAEGLQKAWKDTLGKEKRLVVPVDGAKIHVSDLLDRTLEKIGGQSFRDKITVTAADKDLRDVNTSTKLLLNYKVGTATRTVRFELKLESSGKPDLPAGHAGPSRPAENAPKPAADRPKPALAADLDVAALIREVEASIPPIELPPRVPRKETWDSSEPVRLEWTPPYRNADGELVVGRWSEHDGSTAGTGTKWSDWKSLEYRDRQRIGVRVDTDELSQTDLHQFADMLTRNDSPDLAQRILARAGRLDTDARGAMGAGGDMDQVIWSGQEIADLGEKVRTVLKDFAEPSPPGGLARARIDELKHLTNRLDSALKGYAKDAAPFGGVYTLRNELGPLVGSSRSLLDEVVEHGAVTHTSNEGATRVIAGLDEKVRKTAVSKAQNYRRAKAYAEVPTGTQWSTTIPGLGDLKPEQRVLFVRERSEKNLKDLHTALDELLDGNEQFRNLFEALQGLPYRIKHSTPAYHAIGNSGLLASQGDLARRDAKFLTSGKSSDANTSSLGNDDFAFFRVEANDAKMVTRYGPTTMVFDSSVLTHYDGWVSLHDQLQPLDRLAMRELKPREAKVPGAGPVRTTEYANSVTVTGSKSRWVHTYPGRKGSARTAGVSFEQEVFTGEHFVEGLSLSVVREVSRIGGDFEDEALRLGATITSRTETAAAKELATEKLADIVFSMYRPEAKFGSGLPIDPRPTGAGEHAGGHVGEAVPGRFGEDAAGRPGEGAAGRPGQDTAHLAPYRPTHVHNPHGDGRYLSDGTLDPVALTGARMADRADDSERLAVKELSGGTNGGLKSAHFHLNRALVAADKSVERTTVFRNVAEGSRLEMAENLLKERMRQAARIQGMIDHLNALGKEGVPVDPAAVAPAAGVHMASEGPGTSAAALHAVSPKAPQPHPVQTHSVAEVGDFTQGPKQFMEHNQVLLRMSEGMEIRHPGLGIDNNSFVKWLDDQERHWFTLTRSPAADEHNVYLLTPAVEKYAHAYSADPELQAILGGREMPRIGPDADYIAAHYVPYKTGVTTDPAAHIGHRTIPMGRGGEFNPDFVFTGTMNGCALTVTPGREAETFTAWHYQSPSSHRLNSEEFRMARRPTDWFGHAEYQGRNPEGLPEIINVMYRGPEGWQFLSQEVHASFHNLDQTRLVRFDNRPVQFAPGHEWSYTRTLYQRAAQDRLDELDRLAVENVARLSDSDTHLKHAYEVMQRQARKDVEALSTVTGPEQLAERGVELADDHLELNHIVETFLAHQTTAEEAGAKKMWRWQKVSEEVLFRRNQVRATILDKLVPHWGEGLRREATAAPATAPPAPAVEADITDAVSPRAPGPSNGPVAPHMPADSGTVPGGVDASRGLAGTGPHWDAVRGAAVPVHREHSWPDPVSRPYGPDDPRRIVVTSGFDVRRFSFEGRNVTDLSVRVHMDGVGDVAPHELDALWRRAQDGVHQVFNAGGHRLPGGDVLHVTLERGTRADSHLKVTVGADAEATQHTWRVTAPPLELAHEIGHQLGLRDEYRGASHPDGPAVEGSLMGDYRERAPGTLERGGVRDRYLHLLNALIGDVDIAPHLPAAADAHPASAADPAPPVPSEPAPGSSATPPHTLSAADFDAVVQQHPTPIARGERWTMWGHNGDTPSGSAYAVDFPDLNLRGVYAPPAPAEDGLGHWHWHAGDADEPVAVTPLSLRSPDPATVGPTGTVRPQSVSALEPTLVDDALAAAPWADGLRWRTDAEDLYVFSAGDPRGSEGAFTVGLRPAGDRLVHVVAHAQDGGAADSLWVTATRDIGWLRRQASDAGSPVPGVLDRHPWRYDIAAPGGADVNASLDIAAPHPERQEVLFLGGVRADRIRGAQRMDAGRPVGPYVTNPGFVDVRQQVR
ncbi:hypothetical protein NMG29_09365 [Streptomyces cocklensis]|uniref:Pierisin-like domain-containing protein n=1 Tax=Actinacidiphila cocklensis TaxID=887465 RepID=A0A9W4DZM9_9ACTN|nr:hypothetical protein [Actinacidiphila cocklensis]MDD1058425.1 hypothetical protein [Actinacidiphila cocklensis]CAG6390573.1 hypothetical protein SCOCK_10041 [Actinacidiphila cocklensis]